jgi:hypothetical protein
MRPCANNADEFTFGKAKWFFKGFLKYVPVKLSIFILAVLAAKSYQLRFKKFLSVIVTAIRKVHQEYKTQISICFQHIKHAAY